MINKTIKNWRTVKLGDVCPTVFSGGTPDTRILSYWKGSLPWLSSGETSQTFITTTEKHISDDAVKNSSTRLAKNGDVVIATAGQGWTRGQTSLLKIDTYINQSIIALRPNSDELDPAFLFYNLQLRYPELRALSDSTSSRGSITGPLMKDLDMCLPTIEVQRRIAEILLVLDEKIENNNRIIKTLEETVRVFFKEWFEKDVNKEELVQFTDYVQHRKNQVIPSNLPQTLFSHYSIPAFDAQRTPVLEPGVKILSNKYAVPSLSILFSKLNPTTPRVWSVFDAPDNSVCSTEFLVFQPKDRDFYAYVYSFLSFSASIRELSNGVQGTSTSHQRLRPEDILNVTFPKPDTERVVQFQELVFPMLTKIDSAIKENAALVTMRDLFLPRLMRGEIQT